MGGAMQRLLRVLGVATAQLETRHRASGLNTRFNGGQLAFADYVAQTRDMIGKVRAGASADDLEKILKKIIEGNAPFELKPAAGFPPGQKKIYKHGVLLTHGLTDSPYFMRHLAAFFQENGFRVMAVLLPGHGTQPGDLLDVRWQEWARAVAYGADRLADEVDEVYLAGFSAGGALSVCQSLRDKRVRGLFLFSPAIKITPRAARAKWHKIVRWLMPAKQWMHIMPDTDIYKYESFTTNAAAQLYALTQELGSQLQKYELSIPVFAAASHDDTSVEPSATLEFMTRAHHPCSKLVLYTTDMENLPSGIPAAKLEMVNSALPGQKILSSAHTAIVLPADDAHYGMAGDYANCIHYYPNDRAKYAACKQQAKDIWQGEITDKNLKTGILRRLMVNPNFAALEISMQRFIASLSQSE